MNNPAGKATTVIKITGTVTTGIVTWTIIGNATGTVTASGTGIAVGMTIIANRDTTPMGTEPNPTAVNTSILT